MDAEKLERFRLGCVDFECYENPDRIIVVPKERPEDRAQLDSFVVAYNQDGKLILDETQFAIMAQLGYTLTFTKWVRDITKRKVDRYNERWTKLGKPTNVHLLHGLASG